MIILAIVLSVCGWCVTAAWTFALLSARGLCVMFGGDTGERTAFSVLFPIGLTIVLGHELTKREENRLKRKAMRRDEIEELVRKSVRELTR